MSTGHGLLSFLGTRVPTRVDVIPSSPKRTEDSNKPPLCSDSRGEELGRERDARRGTGVGSSHIRPWPSSGRLWSGCRPTSLLAVTGQSKKMKIHHYLGNQTTGKAVTLSPLPLPSFRLPLSPPPPQHYPLNMPLRSQDRVCVRKRGANEANRDIQDVGKENTLSKHR